MNNRYVSLDDFMQSICSKDTNVRLSIFSDLEEYLQSEHSILLWVSSSNFKVAINGLRIVHLLIERLPDKLLNHAIESKNTFITPKLIFKL